MKHYELMSMADEIMDYLNWSEIDIDLIEPMYHQLIYEKSLFCGDKVQQ